MTFTDLNSISPIDGRYANKLLDLQPIFSEFGLMRYRLLVEIKWLETLAGLKKTKEIKRLSIKSKQTLEKIIDNFSNEEAIKIKAIEKTTNHDIKALEYYLKAKIAANPELKKIAEFTHFGCTSDDINNLAHGLMIQAARKKILVPKINEIITLLENVAKKLAATPMLARTHGQPATPTTMGKELINFAHRLKRQQKQLKTIKLMGKFNGATGNYNALLAAYPNIDWIKTGKEFVENLGLSWNSHTTQIEPHDYIAELSHAFMRLNTILIDFCRDIWHYIALNYFKQKLIKQEIGSSTMPHKINPIDFENAEGNLGIANTLFQHFANKLPISRLQRDLSDSTVLRNIGVAFAHSLLAYQSLIKGINKLEANKILMQQELAQHWELLAEPIQMVMRKYEIEKPYEKLKSLTRGKKITKKKIHQFIDKLKIPATEKTKLKKLTPLNYLGKAKELVH
jgi:adenylosuccinate lyase